MNMPNYDVLKLMLPDELMEHAAELDPRVRKMVESGSSEELQQLTNHLLDVQELLAEQTDHPEFESCIRKNGIQLARLQNRLNNHIVSMGQRTIFLGRSLVIIGLIALAAATVCMFYTRLSLSSC